MYKYNKNLIAKAKRLRKNMTRHERHLWYDFLRDYPMKFTRQKSIGNYIADFYCHSEKLIIELDGSQHYKDGNKEYENERTKYFTTLKLKVLRFSNSQIDSDFIGVCDCIDSYI